MFIEPSPYEVASLLTIFIFAVTGLTLRAGADAARSLLLVLYQHRLRARGAAGDRPAKPVDLGRCVSWYLAVTAIFFAAMLGTNTEQRLDAADARLRHGGRRDRLAGRASSAISGCSAGVSDMFLLYDRAQRHVQRSERARRVPDLARAARAAARADRPLSRDAARRRGAARSARGRDAAVVLARRLGPVRALRGRC